MPDISLPKKPFSPKDRPQEYRNLLVEGVLLVAAIGLFFNFLLMPKRHALSEQQAVLGQLTAQNDGIQKNRTDLDALISKMKAAKQDLSTLDDALPLNSRITTTHVLLDSLIASSGLTLSSISTDADDSVIAAGNQAEISNPFASQRQLKVVSVNLGVTGSMDQFLSFLRSLENSARIIDVSGLEITGNKNNLAAFKLTLKTYFYGPVGPASATSPASTDATTTPFK